MVVLIGVTYSMTLVLVLIGLRAQWCEGGKKRAERKRGQNNFSKFHFFSARLKGSHSTYQASFAPAW